MPPLIGVSGVMVLWAAVLLAAVPILRLDLHLSTQVVAPHLFISYSILLLGWALCGPGVAVILTAATLVVLLYLAMATRDASFLLQGFFQVLFFVGLVYFLTGVQRRSNNRIALLEKAEGDINLTREAIEWEAARERSLGIKIDRFLSFQHFVDLLKEAPSIQAIAERIIREAHAVFPKAEEAILYGLDASQQNLELLAFSGKSGDPAAPVNGTIYDQWVLQHARPIVIEDTATDFRFFGSQRAQEGGAMRSLCIHPLLTENKVVGVLRIWATRPGIFSTDDLRLLDVMSGIGAVTIRNRLLFDRMSELAVRDSLTGLYNRQAFQDRLRQECLQAEHAGGVFSLIVFDVDHFKRYNDEFGHAAGDLVLKTIVGLVSPCLSRGDWVARYGGEEFVIVCPATGPSEAKTVAEKVRTAILSHAFALRKLTGTVTASFGVASYPGDARTPEALFQAADKRLYRAKQLGRNRVCGATS